MAVPVFNSATANQKIVEILFDIPSGTELLPATGNIPGFTIHMNGSSQCTITDAKRKGDTGDDTRTIVLVMDCPATQGFVITVDYHAGNPAVTDENSNALADFTGVLATNNTTNVTLSSATGQAFINERVKLFADSIRTTFYTAQSLAMLWQSHPEFVQMFPDTSDWYLDNAGRPVQSHDVLNIIKWADQVVMLGSADMDLQNAIERVGYNGKSLF